MTAHRLDPRRRGQAAIVVAAAAWSTAGLGQRELGADAATQVAGRAFFAAVTLLLVVLAFEGRGTVAAFRTMGRFGVASAVFMAVSSGTFMLALNHTTVANVVFMQAAAPMFAALLGWAVLSDPVPGRTWAAVGVAAAGVALMVGGAAASGAAAMALPFVMTVSFAVVIVITRHRREVSMMPATCASQVLVVAVALPLATPASASADDWAILAALGIGQMGLGLAMLTIGARLISPAEVAIISLLEVVLGPLLVWAAYGEQPAAATLVGGAIVLGAVLLQASGDDGRRREAPLPAEAGAAGRPLTCDPGPSG